MFFEYAVEPAVLTNWDRVRFFLDAFAPSKGRFLAEYPRRWKKMVHDSLDCPDIEKTKITLRLQTLDPRVFSARRDAQYDGGRKWLDNAEQEHLRQPFHAIVARDPSSQPHVLSGADLDSDTPLWDVGPGALVARHPAAVVAALAVLLQASSRVIVIDPYFRADQTNKTDSIVALAAVLAPANATLEVHFSTDPARPSYELCMSHAQRVLPDALPVGYSVTLRCWVERASGPRLHNRYVLTDIGGVKFGDGIERGDEGQDDHLSILDRGSHQKLWDRYAGADPSFDPAGPPKVFQGRARRSR